MKDHGFAVVVIHIAGLKLFEQCGGGFFDRVLVYDDTAVTCLDKRPENTGSSEMSQRLAFPIAVISLIGDQ